MTAPGAGQVTAFFDQVASDWDQMRLAYYDESVATVPPGRTIQQPRRPSDRPGERRTGGQS
jgi:hypothetical protein